MTHDEALSLLSARLDGPLTAMQQAELTAWCAESSDNAVTAEAFQTQHADLTATFEPRREAARRTATAVAQKLPEPIRPATSEPSNWRRNLSAPLPAALAAGVLIAVGLIAFRHDKPHSPIESPSQASDAFTRFGMNPRAKPDAPKTAALAVGETATTAAGEKRRVVLPDGSLVYLNQNTKVEITRDRHIKLAKGEVFVEAIPAKSEADRFIVETAKRAVTALGTKFAVTASDLGTGVLVTQGKVEVTGLDAKLTTGQELAPGGDKPTVGPRASAALDWTRDLMAAAESPLVPAGRYSGGSLVAVDPYGQEAKLQMVKFHVDVHIEDGFARTTIDQTYFNSENQRMEGTFYFPLPPDASLSRLAMYVDGDLMEGGMAESDHARNVYETIRYQNRDPALLEWVDGSVFKMRVFPLEARQEKRIVLSYSQRLPVLYGGTTYRFPAGHTLALVNQWSFQAVVKDGAKLSAQSLSHPNAKHTVKGEDLVLTDEAKNIKIDRDIVLSFADHSAANESTRWSSGELDGQKYLMVRYRPDLPSAPRRERRDWVILFESSAARDPLVARAQVEVIRSLLAHAEHDDTFSVLTVGTRVRKWHNEPEFATEENVARAIAWLERAHLIGATNLDEALTEVTPMLRVGTNPHLVHVGGGVASIGEQRADELVKRIPEGVRYVGIGVGKRVSPAFMKVAAERTGGLFTQVNPDEPINWRGFEIASTLNAPRLLNVRVDCEAAKFLTFSNMLAHGEEFAAVANVTKGAPKSITIQGTLDGQPFTRTLPVEQVESGAAYLPRTWAKLEIDRLLADNSQANRKTITDLSKAMYVMTPFTSLLVLENEQMYRTFNVDRGRKDHWAMYPCPPKIPVVYVPDPNRPAGSVDLKGQKPHENQIIPTILTRQAPMFLAVPGQANADAPNATAGQNLHGYFAMPISEDSPNLGDLDGVMSGADNPLEAQLGAERWKRSSSEVEELSKNLSDGRVKLADREVSFANFRKLDKAKKMMGGRTGGTRNWDLKEIRQWMDEAPRVSSTRDRREQLTKFFMESDGISLNRFGYTNGRDFSGNVIGLNRPTLAAMDFAEPGVVTAFGTSPSFHDEADLKLHNWTLGARSSRDELVRVKVANEWRKLALGMETNGAAPVFFKQTNGSFDEVLKQVQESQTGSFLLGMNGTVAQRGFVDAGMQFFDAATPSDSLTGKRAGKRLLSNKRVVNAASTAPTYYTRPSYNGNLRGFSDLVAYAPGMSSSPADVRAVLEAEAAPRFGSKRGTIDPAARRIIDAARTNEWRTTLIPIGDMATLAFHHDGAGRYAYERTLAFGLHERVVCDGTTLWHLYPEIGVGAKRLVTRFHREFLSDLVSDFVPPAEDFVHGTNVKAIDDHTVAIVPILDRTDDEPLAWYELHLVFAGNRLAERRWVLNADGLKETKLAGREAYSADEIKAFDSKGKEIGKAKRNVKAGTAPDLRPLADKLVVLPLPLRSREQTYTELELDANQDLGSDRNACHSYLSADAAMRLLACEFAANNGTNVSRVWAACFREKGDYRIGFFTLMAAANANPRSWHFDEIYMKNRAEPLVRYLWWLFDGELHEWQARMGTGPRDPKANTFLGRLTAFREVVDRWNGGHIGNDPYWQRDGERARVLEFAEHNANNALGWCALGLVQDRCPNHSAFRDVAKVWGVLVEKSPMKYAARYEEARCLGRAGEGILDLSAQAQAKFQKLYADALNDGLLPPLDASFKSVLEKGSQDDWAKLMRQTAAKCAEKKARPVIVTLAWQCYQLGDTPMADALLESALKEITDEERPLTNLAAIHFLNATSRFDRADVLVRELLADADLAQAPGLWRLASQIADNRKDSVRAIECLETALDFEYADLPEVFDVQPIRNDYGRLLGHYEWLADASTSLKVTPPKDLIARVVRAADRWRHLDPEAPDVPNRVATILRKVGGEAAVELAWDYATTPLAVKPNESAPWISLAWSVRQEGNWKLADKCYEMAFAAEPTNAQLLWDRATYLREQNQIADSRKLMKQLAESEWQPRFSGLKAQARQAVSGQ